MIIAKESLHPKNLIMLLKRESASPPSNCDQGQIMVHDFTTSKPKHRSNSQQFKQKLVSFIATW